jgi:hypothetical protein
VALVLSVTAAAPAFADSTVDQALWSSCQAQSSGSLWFDATSLDWLDGTVLHYNVTVGGDCNGLTQTRIVEDTPQANDNPQTFQLGWGGGWSAGGSMNVTPVRSLTWSLYLINPLGTKQLRPADPNDHRTASVTVNYPQPPLDGSPPSFTVTANSVTQRRQFVQAVQTPGTKVYVTGNVDLDLSGLDGIVVAPNVQILGDRSADPQGPRLFTTTEPSNLFVVPARSGTSERISGVRLQGGSSTDPFANMGDEDSNAILVQKPNVEIDHDEIYLWRGAGIEVMDCDGCDNLRRPVPGDNSTTVWIHDNYIHHEQHPTGDICCGHGEGYGVESSHGGYALVEQNVFDYNRHSMAGGWQPGTGYLFYRNLILPHGGVNSRVSSTHAIDVHGSNKDDSYESGDAGEYFDVEYNTVWNVNGPAIKLRGTPSDRMVVSQNAFAHCSLWFTSTGPCAYFTPALVQTQTGLYESGDLTSVGDDARTTCDFDGDGVNDTFHATGESWWFQSSRLAGRYVYLHQSTSTGSALSLVDRNFDGLCDVVENGTTVPTNPDVTIGPGLWTQVPLLVGTDDATAKAGISAVHLTVGTITVAPSPFAVGTVIDQSPHTVYVRPKGWPVNLVESGGQAIVPNVLSLNEGDADYDIGIAGLNVTTSYTNNCVDPGTVQNQNPSGGVVVLPGTSVHITISTCTGSGGGGGGNPRQPK